MAVFSVLLPRQPPAVNPANVLLPEGYRPAVSLETLPPIRVPNPQKFGEFVAKNS
ncbi:MAG: hypothetical protein O2983_16550 [Planctomycetota bacterium]|nr:hypothetical protein [Planctomycetota bacterium]MDA1161215.1 hypothetical protein [Planctomycetota bacterium]